MQTRRKARLLTGVLASVGLILTGVVAVAAPASAAPGTSPPSPGGATITISNTTPLPGETITVSGSGFAANQHLYVSYCGNPPGGTNCNQIIGDYIDTFADASGVLAPVNLVMKNPIIKGASTVIDCTVGTNPCAVGTSNADVPSDPTWNTVVPITMPKPALSLSASSGPAGTPITVSGSNFPVGPVYKKTSTAPFYANVPLAASLYVTQCAMTGTGPACDTSPPPVINPAFPGNSAGTFPSTSFTPIRFITAVPPGPPGPAQTYDCAQPGLCFVGTSNASDSGSRNYDALSPFQITGVPAFTITSITGQAVTNAARAGDVINVSASNWATAPTAQLCDSAGANCDAAGVTGTLTTSGGALTVAASATTGSRRLVLTDGSDSPYAALTILGAPTLTLAPSSGGAGSSVAVTGTNWNPTGTVAVDNGIGNLTASATGAISGTWTAAGSGTVVITGTQGSLSASANFTVGADSCNAPCSLDENVELLITGGILSMAKDPGIITMAGVNVGPAQNSTGSLRDVTVTDARGGTAGWSLTGKMTDLTAPGGTIPATAMTWSPGCSQLSGPAAGANLVTGATAQLDNTVTRALCSVTSGGPGGIYLADAALSLAIPDFQPAGLYTATLTIALA